MNSISILVDSESENERIDKFISFTFPNSSRSYIQKAILNGNVLVNGVPVSKNYRLKADDRVSFCCYDEGFRRPDEWALNIRSVIIFGRVRFLEDQDLAMEVSRKLSYRFTKDEAYIDEEVRRSGPRTLCFELIPEHMTGKLVNES